MELELSHLIEALPGLVWTALPDGRAEFLSRRWCEYTGLSLEQAVGVGWQSALHPEDVDVVLEYWRSILESRQSGEVEARLRRYDGEYRRFLFSAAPLADKLRTMLKANGRDAREVEIIACPYTKKITPDDLKKYGAAGVDELVILASPPDDESQISGWIERLARDWVEPASKIRRTV